MVSLLRIQGFIWVQRIDISMLRGFWNTYLFAYAFQYVAPWKMEFLLYHNLPIWKAHLQFKFAASYRVLFTLHIHVCRFLQFISHHPGCINFQCCFFLTLFPHLILKSGGQNNGSTKDRGNKGTKRERKYLPAFFYFTAELDWADLVLTDRKSVEKKKNR